MERNQQREQRKRRESRPRNVGSRQERSPRENSQDKPERNIPNRNEKQNQQTRPRLTPIHLRRDEKDIKLNEEQQKQVFELDQKIGAIGKVEIPENSVRENKNKEFDNAIDKLNSQLQTQREKIDQIQKRQDNYEKAHNPHKAEQDETRQKIKEIDAILNPIKEKVETIRQQRISLRSKIQNMKEKAPAKSIEDIDYQIQDLEYQIETTTLSNAQLKAKLSKIESLKKSRAQFGGIAEMGDSIGNLRETEEELNAKKKKLQDERNKLWESLSQFKGEFEKLRGEREKFKAERNATFEQINKIRDEINEKYAAKREFNDKFIKERNELYKKKDQLAILLHQRLQIFQDAERHMDLLEKGAKQAGEIKERRNPNEDKIAAARSLVGYLQGIIALDDMKDDDEKAVECGKAQSTEALSLVNSIKKSSKKDKKAAKKEKKVEDKAKNTKINLSLEAIQQFVTVGVTQPTAIDQIPNVIAELKKNIQQWSDAFIKLNLEFKVQPDGSIKSTISLD